MKRYVLTGTAFAGKTTLLDALAKKGYSTVPEAARFLIARNVVKKSQSLPWINLDLFLVDLLQKQLELENQITGNQKPIFLDRSPIDQLAYFKYFQKPVTPEYLKIFQENRYDGVFLLETLPNYQVDEIRKEPPKMVEALRSLHEISYLELGYDAIVVPIMSVSERADFVLRHLN
jgi:predicted ATPase